MTQEWIKQNFVIEQMEDSNGSIADCAAVDDQGTFCPLHNMLSMFGTVDATYAALSETAQAAAGGWQPIFDLWKVKEIIS